MQAGDVADAPRPIAFLYPAVRVGIVRGCYLRVVGCERIRIDRQGAHQQLLVGRGQPPQCAGDLFRGKTIYLVVQAGACLGQVQVGRAAVFIGGGANHQP